MSTDLAVIEAALQAATLGPWEASADNAVPDRAAILTAWCFEGEDAELVTDWCTLPDAHLIANAPAWLAELVERVRLLEGAIDGIRSSARTDRFACCACCLEDHDADSELVNNHTLPCNICQDPWKARAEAAEAAVERVRAESLAQGWDERDNARAQYLGPDHGHYEGCMGYEDCYCGTYPNPYRAAGSQP